MFCIDATIKKIELKKVRTHYDMELSNSISQSFSGLLLSIINFCISFEAKTIS